MNNPLYPPILVSFESNIKNHIKSQKKIKKCSKLRVSRDVIDNLNLYFNRFLKVVVSTAIMILENKQRKTITENELNIIFHVMFDPEKARISNVRIPFEKEYYKEFMQNPNRKKPASIKDKYDPVFIEYINPNLVFRAVRILLPKGYRITELAIAHLTSMMEHTYEYGFGIAITRFCDLLKDPNYKGKRTFTYDYLKEIFKIHTTPDDYGNKYYDIESMCRLLP